MYFNKICKRIVSLVLLVMLMLPLTSLIKLTTVRAITAADKITYPFAGGDLALVNAPTIKGQDAQSSGAVWEWYEQKFDAATDLTNVKYLAVEYKNTVGDPGLTLGVMSNGQRFGTYIDGKPIYFVKQDGTIVEKSVLYSSVNLGTEPGTILIPMSSLSLVGWGVAGTTLSNATSFFFETNAQYNWGFEMKIGEVGTYADEPTVCSMNKILDLSKEVKRENFYASCVTVSFPENAVDTTKVAYPFKTGDNRLVNAPTITGQAAQTTGATYQWYESIFDAPVDLTGVDYLAVEYKNVVGDPGLTIGVMSNGQRFGTYIDGKPIYFVKTDGTVVEKSVLYSSVNLGTEDGMILIPMSSLSLVGWGVAGTTLSNATSFFFETNAQYNWGFEMKIGEIATYVGNPVVATPTKVLDLSTEIKRSQVYSSFVTVSFPAVATDTTKEPESFTYPFSDGTKNAPTFVGHKAQALAPTYQYAEVIFDATADLSAATYLAVEFIPKKGNPGITVGVIGQGARFGTYTDGEKAYVVYSDGQVVELSVLYSSINLGTKAGMLLLPMSSLSKVGWFAGEASTSQSTAFWFETNAQYNWDFELTIGEIGYYTGDPMHAAKMTKTLDLSNGMKKDQIYSSELTVDFPASSEVSSIDGMKAQYPFQTGDAGFNNTLCWVGTAGGDAADNWQTFTAQFDTVNLTGASYIAIQYATKTGAPGITFGVTTGNTRYSIVGSSGEEICMMDEQGNINKACYITYDAITISGGQKGCLLIPMSYLKYQFGDVENTLETVKNLILTTNSKYNYAFELLIGEIGYYTGQPCDENFTYTRLSGLNYGTPDYYYSVTADNKDNMSTKYVYVTEKNVYGDTKIEYTATGKIEDSIIPWVGGAGGKQTMTTDSYGDQALRLMCTGARENADAYTAFTIFDGKQIDWSNAKGVTLWARNDSDVEISFNLEIDVLSSHTSARGRFNITQGNRFWLYDVNTNEQTIYMTRPCVTLPVGFEGWVRIPFDAFDQAAWSLTDPNYGVFERQYFMTEGSFVPYLGITVYSGSYTNKAFSVNKIGGYETTPSFISAIIPATATRCDILTLMGLKKEEE